MMKYTTTAPVLLRITAVLLAGTLPACGDSADPGVDGGAGNDNGNVNNSSGRCGNGQIDTGEECDDGADNSDSTVDACRTSCLAAHCGDGVVDTGEPCDDGAGNSDVVPDACRQDCAAPSCGDAVVDVEAGETCDDGNTAEGDGCSPACIAEYCGNGIRELDEVCDDGNWNANDGCSPDCRSDESCGNGIVDLAAGEECDLGANNSDAPDTLCHLLCTVPRCGDGIVDHHLGEDCEPSLPMDRDCDYFGYYAGTPTCDADCRYDPADGCTGTCGDGVVSGPEMCDGGPPIEECTDFGYGAGAIDCTGICAADFSRCAWMGWRGLISGTTVDLTEIWGTSPADIFVTGKTDDQGVPVLRHWDGAAWSDMAHPGTGDIKDIWGTAWNNVYAASGDHILHYDGTQWTVDYTDTRSGSFAEVTGNGPDNVWATGLSKGVHHWNGTQWEEESPPVSHTFTLWVAGTNNVWVAGSTGLLYHYTGSWNPVTSNTTRSLYDMWGSSPSDIFAVGAFGTVIHYDGSTWEEMPNPATTTLSSVWGTSAHDVWVAGRDGELIHYDGKIWSRHDSQSALYLNGVWGSGTRDVWVVGNQGLLRKYDGGMRLSGEAITEQSFPHFWASSAHDIFALNPWDEIHRWDGETWTHIHTAAENLYGLWGSSPRDVHFVGANSTLLHYTGSAWITETSPVAVSWVDVHGTDEENVFAVGGATHVARFDGSAWASMPTPPGNVGAVWAATPDEVFALGEDLYRWDGSLWHTVPLPGVGDPKSLWGFSENDVFVVGYDGALWHYDGTQARQQHTGGDTLFALWGRSATDVFAVGGSSRILHYDGDEWSPVRPVVVGDFSAITHSFGHGLLINTMSFSTLQRFDYAFGNRLACPEYHLPACGPEDVRFQQMNGGTPDYMELVNTGCCAVDLSGFELRWRLACDSVELGHTIAAGTVLEPGAVLRFLDTTSNLQVNERYIGQGICDYSYQSGWAALCEGACDLTTCANVLDYFEKTDGTAADGAPTCATMSPKPMDVAGLNDALAPTRRALRGRGPNAIRTDWSLATPTRE